MMEHFSSRIGGIASTYGTDTIFILGKGPSADAVSPDAFVGSLVIGVNDAERIAPVDITLFHADWVKQAVVANGLRSRLYVTSTDFTSPDRETLRAPFVPLQNDNNDMLMQRFLSDSFAIEEVLFLSALNVARQVARARGRRQTVYMVGFDFRPDAGVSEAINHDYAPSNSADRFFRISMQEFFFLNCLYMLKDSDLDVVHVGDRSFSQLSAEGLNRRFHVSHGETSRRFCAGVQVTAELTTNHFGDRNRLERMIRAAWAAGADHIKLQKRDVQSFYTAEQLASPYVSPFGKTFGDYRRQLELDRDDFAFVDALCQELGIHWFASVLDQPSFEFMLQFDPAMVKLPSTISEHRDYLSYVARNYRGSVVLSTGMTGLEYEKWLLGSFVNCRELYLLQCNSAYPTPKADCNVAVVRHYHGLSQADHRIVPGYSSHDFGWLASALAVAAGARMVEKHVKLGNSDWAHFDAVAVDLTTSDFRDYVAMIREAEELVGSGNKVINPSEHHKYLRAAA
ncbi:N-acetylneuraminate synthase family protein [Sphingomonas sp. IC-56]|uniref:N-acetylneuraminate synthase family protein n=1 Tax=Sphingomonas sp. IC-56 TaxID=2898529 RepID=UPI001E485185|nr:N-acetylneuraminate synthase family protein [Sphingomonas sp. IC-56]MCD2324459.1 N-acetylneuraminate synthase family protein [Sphingomonas sp. IC-56]